MVLEGGAYISTDRHWRWNGAAWIPNIEAINWHWPGVKVVRPADYGVVGCAGAVAVLFDIAVRSGTLALGATLCAVAIAAGLVFTRRVRTRSAIAAAGLAAIFAAFWSPTWLRRSRSWPCPGG
jgi:hypothetical protein